MQSAGGAAVHPLRELLRTHLHMIADEQIRFYLDPVGRLIEGSGRSILSVRWGSGAFGVSQRLDTSSKWGSLRFEAS